MECASCHGAPPPPDLAPLFFRNHLSRCVNATPSADQLSLDPPDTAAGTPVCEARGCGRLLTPVQIRKRVVLELRAEIERG